MSDPLERCRYFTRPGLTLSSYEVDEAERLTEVGKRMLADRMRAFVEAHRHEPMFMRYSSDSTPSMTVEQIQGTIQALTLPLLNCYNKL